MKCKHWMAGMVHSNDTECPYCDSDEKDALVSEAIAQYEEIGEVLLGGVDDSGEYEECEVEIPQRTLYSLQEQVLKSTLPMRLKLYVRIEPIAAIKAQGDAK